MKRISGLLFLLAVFGFYSARAGATDYTTSLLGSNENPNTGSPATGFADVNVTGDTLSVNVNFSGLTVPASAAHIHCCVVTPTNTGVAVPFVGFPSATSGTYSHVFNMTDTSIYTASYLAASGGTAAGAESALKAALVNNGNQPSPPTLLGTYVNIHTSQFPGGEIRGFPSVPEPSTLALMAVGASAFGFVARRRHG